MQNWVTVSMNPSIIITCPNSEYLKKLNWLLQIKEIAFWNNFLHLRALQKNLSVISLILYKIFN